MQLHNGGGQLDKSGSQLKKHYRQHQKTGSQLHINQQ
jgi:hypothetical protein